MLISCAIAATVAIVAEPVIVDDASESRLAIMSLTAAGVPEDYALGLTETIATAIAGFGVFETISPRQIKSLLSYEKRRDALGDCANEACFTQVAKVVRADYLVAGSVSKVGDQLVLNLVLIDHAKGAAIKRTNRKTTDPSALMSEAEDATIALLQPVLTKRQGYLQIASNVEDAQIVVDDELRPERVGQVIALGSGPHTVKIKRDGFYSANTRLTVFPGRLSTEQVSLIPAKETIEAYETKANLMRYGAYATGVVAVAGAVASAIFYARATDDRLEVDTFSNLRALEQADPVRRTSAVEARDSFTTNQAFYIAGLGAAVVAGATSLWLFIAGDDPGRYDEYESVAR